MSTIEWKVGQRIASQRHAVGLTQAQLAEGVGVQVETISRVESGRRTASLRLLVRVSETLEIGLEELFRTCGNGPKSRAMERLIWFASRLTSSEIDLVLDVGSVVIRRMRHTVVH